MLVRFVHTYNDMVVFKVRLTCKTLEFAHTKTRPLTKRAKGRKQNGVNISLYTVLFGEDYLETHVILVSANFNGYTVFSANNNVRALVLINKREIQLSINYFIRAIK